MEKSYKKLIELLLKCKNLLGFGKINKVGKIFKKFEKALKSWKQPPKKSEKSWKVEKNYQKSQFFFQKNRKVEGDGKYWKNYDKNSGETV